MSILDVLGGLLAFDWFDRARSARAMKRNTDELMIALMPRALCRDCEDEVYVDLIDGRQVKHASTRTVMRKAPPSEGGLARLHPAVWELPGPDEEDEEPVDAWHGTTNRILLSRDSARAAGTRMTGGSS